MNITRRSLILAAASMPFAASAQTIQVTGAGATFPAPLYHRWAQDAERKIGVKVNYQSIGSGAGINQIRSRTVTFGATDAPLTDPGDLYQFPTIEGEVVAIFNIPGIRSINLTMEVVNRIYKGELTRWNAPAIVALNPGVRIPAMPIAPVYRGDGSGTTFIWTNAMKRAGNWDDAGTSIRWPVGMGARGNEGVTNMVARTPGAIGYAEVAFARINNLPYATLDSSVVGRTYILLPKQPRDRAAHNKAVEFFEYAFTEGLAVASNMYYKPLPSSEYASIISELKSL